MWEWTPPSDIWRNRGVEGMARMGHRGGTYETEEVEAAVAVLCPVKALEDELVLVELPLLDRDIDPDDVLPDDASRTDVQVAADGTLRQSTI